MLKLLQPAQLTLMAGKSSYDLNLDDPSDSDRLWELVKDADVILQGYRLRSLEHRGFGLDAVLEMASARGKGIIYLDENCYGLEGYMAERPG